MERIKETSKKPSHHAESVSATPRCQEIADQVRNDDCVKSIMFRSLLNYFLLLCSLLLQSCDKLSETVFRAEMAYHFDAPASIWEETFPLGNGRIGLMPDGGIERETYVLNEISMWSGSRQDTDNPDTYKSLAAIRNLLFEDRNDEAQQLMYETFVPKGEGSGQGRGANKPYGSYQLLGNMILHNEYTESGIISDYRRVLNLENAIATVSFKKEEIKYTREAFSSFSSDIAVVRLTADKQEALRFRININRPERYTVSIAEKDLLMYGQLNDGTVIADENGNIPSESGKGIRYGAKIRVLLPRDGILTSVDDSTLFVKDASEAILLIGMATDYFCNDVDEQLDSLLNAAGAKSFDELRNEHIEIYRNLYARVQVDFGHVAAKERLPMNERLEVFQQDQNDPSLMALYYQFGRYLLISSTRPGLLPPNLQGLWCNTINTPWNGDYHLNINLQMNLWPAETGNLSELHLPLIEWTKQQMPSGRRTAKVFYNARGWVTHILGNVWEFTAPGEHPSWGATNTSAAWLCAQLYHHYLYTKDIAYLSDVYPVMKEAALFFVDMLVEDPRSLYLVTAPTTSPENTYILPNGREANVCAGSTMDNQILRELFGNTIDAAALLGIDEDFSAVLNEKRSRLMPTTIGTDGRIMEWLEQYSEKEPQHRHVSHLYGLYPGNEISLLRTPDLAQAARKSLEARGDESTGWSMAWKINFWARLHDGERAFKLLTDLLKPCIRQNEIRMRGGGTYPNLFCAHPPFQIDGNFGGSAGIAEMLIQSQNDCIELLPALPEAWKTGSFKGLKVRGGGEVSASWREGMLQKTALKATIAGSFRIKLPKDSTALKIKLNGKQVSFPVISNMLIVEMQSGDELLLEF
jgi:alpha-L-fucosidase 2